MFGFPANWFRPSKNLKISKYHRKFLPHSNFVIFRGKTFANIREFVRVRVLQSQITKIKLFSLFTQGITKNGKITFDRVYYLTLG